MMGDREMDTRDRTEVLQAVQLVAKELRTSFHTKKHGGIAEYSDERLTILLDTYVPNTFVLLRDGGSDQVWGREGTCVLKFQSGGRFELFRPGQWIDYVLSLRGKAEAKVRNREVEAEVLKRFAPVDDSDLFQGVA